MKIGDLVRMKTPFTVSGMVAGLIRKIVPPHPQPLRMGRFITFLWPDAARMSMQFEDEIVVVAKVDYESR